MPSDFLEQLQTSIGSLYTIERELGGGGMSRVFLAVETALGRKVVVKVLPPETAAGVSIERFKREILLAARLQHPHIVPLLSAGEAIGLPYFTMPFVAGDSVRVRLARQGEFPVTEAIRVLREIASALAYAHEHGIVHRDIKPDNVLLSGGSAIVTDFGVAKALSESSNAESSGVTSIGVALGTPAYMAPEQATADPAIDHRADIYAFGVLAYELLTGQPPFTGRTPAHLLAAHVNEAPENISRRRATLPPALGVLVMRCLEKRPSDRMQSAGEIVHTLDDLSTPSGGMQPTSARAAVKGMAAGTGVSTRPKFSIGRVAVVAVSLVALVAIGWVAVRAGRTLGGDETVNKTIAVLPFSSGGDTASEYFAEGITDELQGELARAQGLTVKARSVRTQFKDHESDLAAVAMRLGIGTLVVGSVRRAGGQVRITAELMRVSDNSTLWSQTFSAEERSLFALQDSVARAIAGALQSRLAVTRAGPAGTKDLAAYDLYLKGKFLFEKRGEQSIRRAIVLFQQAAEADSSFARAYAALGYALLLLPNWSNTSSDSVHAPALAAVEKAFSLDSTLAEAHAARGIAFQEIWPLRWHEAENFLRRAIELDPRFAAAHIWLGGGLVAVGRIEEGITELRRATVLEPYYAEAWSNLGFSQMAARQFEGAIASYRHAVAVDASYSDIVQPAVAIAFVLQGNSEAALREMTSLTDSGANPVDLAGHGFVYARAGQRTRAQAIARDLERRARMMPDVMGPLGYVMLGLGDSSHALEWFIRAADAHVRPFRGLWADIPSPEVDPIRGLPRYPELLRKLNLQDQPVAKLKAAGR